MPWDLPKFDELVCAIDIYLARAYTGPPPAAVKNRLEQFRAAKNQWPSCAAVERDASRMPPRFALRLGNQFYPHMKLMIESSPDALTFLYRADTHDRHISIAPGGKERQAFLDLMKKNQEIALAIESDWEAAGVPTFKAFLRRDLTRRAAISMTSPAQQA